MKHTFHRWAAPKVFGEPVDVHSCRHKNDFEVAELGQKVTQDNEKEVAEAVAFMNLILRVQGLASR